MKNTKAERLLERYRTGTLTEQEQLDLEAWYYHYYNAVDPFEDAQVYESALKQMDQAFPFIDGQIKSKLSRVRIAVAAAVLFMLSAGVWLYYNKTSSPASLYKNDVLAGGNKAYLTLSNGTRILLTGAPAGTLAKQSGIEITKTSDGQVVYTVTSQQKIGTSTEYNTIETPRGGQYQVRLPDGTNVWLNASSSLKFPASFAKLSDRSVDLNGEAYFEVYKDKLHPFIVKSKNQEIKVLGTHFNISNYADELEVKTTLLEGSVMINNSFTLNPGEQSILKNGKINVYKVDPDEAIAWKKGYFQFTDESLESILLKVSRWYDVEVKFEDEKAKKVTFSGTMSRYKTISGILDKLEKIGAGNFRIEGKTVTVMK